MTYPTDNHAYPTDDHVAQLASRLYNEGLDGHRPPGDGTGVGQAANGPIDPAADSALREQFQAPSFPMPAGRRRVFLPPPQWGT
jgi:hypothetical protein